MIIGWLSWPDDDDDDDPHDDDDDDKNLSPAYNRCQVIIGWSIGGEDKGFPALACHRNWIDKLDKIFTFEFMLHIFIYHLFNQLKLNRHIIQDFYI